MEKEASESCFCNETLDIILGIGSGVLQHMHIHCRAAFFTFTEIMRATIIKGYLQQCRSFISLKSPVSGSSLFSSRLISLLISLCWRNRSSSLAVRLSQDLERESG